MSNNFTSSDTYIFLLRRVLFLPFLESLSRDEGRSESRSKLRFLYYPFYPSVTVD